MAERRSAIDPSMSDKLETLDLDELLLETEAPGRTEVIERRVVRWRGVLILDAEPSTSADPAGDVR
jgi:hypothetical protein